MIVLPNLREGYVELLNSIVQRGFKARPRGLPTRALSNPVIRLDDVTDALPVGVGRKISVAIAAIESAQLTGGCVDPALMLRIAPRFGEFMDDGRFWGGYGNRVGSQLLHAIKKIKDDRDTRQAIVTLWDPLKDNMMGKRDYPCTISLGFAIVQDQLELSVYMRSNDAWLGLAYDAFVFTQCQLTVARILDVMPGPYYHHVMNLHVYESDVEKVEALKLRSVLRPTWNGMMPIGFGRDKSNLDPYATLMRARWIGQGKLLLRPTSSERWYLDALAPFIEHA